MRHMPVGPVVVMLALAGCLGGDDAADRDGSDVEPPGSVAFEDDLDGCTDVSHFFFRDLEALRQHLPPGFTPSDSSGVFGIPVPTGQGIITLSSLTCEGSSAEGGPLGLAGAFILVEPPRFEGVDIERDDVEAFVAAYYSSSSAQVEALLAWGVDAVAARTEGTPTGGDPPLVASLEIEAGGVVEARFDSRAPARNDFGAGGSNSWHVADGGVVLLDVKFGPREFNAGHPTTCALRTGGRLAELFGPTRCTEDTVVAFLGTDDAYEFRWRVFPGVYAGAP